MICDFAYSCDTNYIFIIVAAYANTRNTQHTRLIIRVQIGCRVHFLAHRLVRQTAVLSVFCAAGGLCAEGPSSASSQLSAHPKRVPMPSSAALFTRSHSTDLTLLLKPSPMASSSAVHSPPATPPQEASRAATPRRRASAEERQATAPVRRRRVHRASRRRRVRRRRRSSQRRRTRPAYDVEGEGQSHAIAAHRIQAHRSFVGGGQREHGASTMSCASYAFINQIFCFVPIMRIIPVRSSLILRASKLNAHVRVHHLICDGAGAAHAS